MKAALDGFVVTCTGQLGSLAMPRQRLMGGAEWFSNMSSQLTDVAEVPTPKQIRLHDRWMDTAICVTLWLRQNSMDMLMSPCFCKHFLLAYRHLLIQKPAIRCFWSRCHTSTSTVQRSVWERAMPWPSCPHFYPPKATCRDKDIPPCSALRIVMFFAQQLKIANAKVPRSADRPTHFPSFGSGRKHWKTL